MKYEITGTQQCFQLRGVQLLVLAWQLLSSDLSINLIFRKCTHMVPLVLNERTMSITLYQQQDKTNLSRDGLNPPHVPCQQVNNLTVYLLCKIGVGRADIEEPKSNVAMNAWPPQASYPCGNFSDTSSFVTQKSKGSLGQTFQCSDSY